MFLGRFLWPAEHVVIDVARIGIGCRPISRKVHPLLMRHGPGSGNRSRGTVANASTRSFDCVAAVKRSSSE